MGQGLLRRVLRSVFLARICGRLVFHSLFVADSFPSDDARTDVAEVNHPCAQLTLSLFLFSIR